MYIITCIYVYCVYYILHVLYIYIFICILYIIYIIYTYHTNMFCGYVYIYMWMGTILFKSWGKPTNDIVKPCGWTDRDMK